MQLTIVVRKVNRITSNFMKTVKSFRHKDIELLDIIFIDKILDIDYGMIKSDWWVVFHDDEFIEKRLLDAMIVGSKCEQYDGFSFYKLDLNTRVTICPRMFRRGVKLEPGCLYPVMPIRMETLLDGWVLEHGHDCNEIRSTTFEDDGLQDGSNEVGVHRGIPDDDSELCKGVQASSGP